MKKSFFTTVAFFFALALFAEDLEPGIYYVSESNMRRIEQQAAGGASPRFGMGSGNMSASVSFGSYGAFSGASAEVQTSTTPEFLFVYSQHAGIGFVNGNVFMCKYTMKPQLGILVHLAVVDGKKRMLDGFPYTHKTLNELVVTAIDKHHFWVRLKEPLKPGEYGFVFRYIDNKRQPPAMEYLWPFSVVEQDTTLCK